MIVSTAQTKQPIKSNFFAATQPVAIKSGYCTKSASQKSFISIADTLLQHIIESPELSSSEKLFYLLNELYSSYLLGWKGKNPTFSAKKTAGLLSFSKSKVFTIQKKLEKLGYLVIDRSSNGLRQNNVNIVKTTLPDAIFHQLVKSPNKNQFEQLNLSTDHISKEDRNSTLNKYKQFIPIKLESLRQIFFNRDLSATSKIIYLSLFTTIYKIKQKKNLKFFAAHISIENLSTSSNFSRSSIFRALKDLEDQEFIKRDKVKIESENESSNRFDKFIHYISLVNENIKDIATDRETDRAIANLHQAKIPSQTDPISSSLISPIDPPSVTDGPSLYINTYKNKTIDLIKSNSNILNSNQKNLSLENKIITKCSYQGEAPTIALSQSKSLLDYHPITTQLYKAILEKSGRSFTLQVVNQILLSLSKKLENQPLQEQKIFYSDNGFISYMAKVIKNEKRVEHKVNNENFYIRINLTEDQKQEQYLSKIELDPAHTKDKICLKKLISLFDRDRACNLAKNYKSCKVSNDRTILYLSKPISFTDSEKDKISQIIESTYYKPDIGRTLKKALVGKNSEKANSLETGFITQDRFIAKRLAKLEIKILSAKTLSDKNSINKQSNSPKIWQEIRALIRDRLGEGIDQSWFSEDKIKAKIDRTEEKQEITLEVSSLFFKEHVSTNYLQDLKNFAALSGGELKSINVGSGLSI